MLQLSDIRRLTLLSVILIGTLLGPLDSAVNIAFPDITASFGIELASIRWVVIAYVATYASLMLVFGRIGDLIGHNRVFAAGLFICILGFGSCSLASSYSWLLVARILRGALGSRAEHDLAGMGAELPHLGRPLRFQRRGTDHQHP